MDAIKMPITMGKYCRATRISSGEVYYQVVILNPQEREAKVKAKERREGTGAHNQET